jgi:hypothetical protein
MSRERTPAPADLDGLAAQLRVHPPAGKAVAHVLISRTAAGSSARLAAAFACLHLQYQAAREAAGLSPRGFGPTPHAALAAAPAKPGDAELEAAAVTSPTKRQRLLTGQGLAHADSDLASQAGSARCGLPRRSAWPMPPGARSAWLPRPTRPRPAWPMRRRSLDVGEFRGVVNLLRVLPLGAASKAAVDAAAEAAAPIGNLLADIAACREAGDRGAEPAGGAAGGPGAKRRIAPAVVASGRQAGSSGTVNMFAARVSSRLPRPSAAAVGGGAAAAVEALRLGLHYLQRYFYLVAFR